MAHRSRILAVCLAVLIAPALCLAAHADEDLVSSNTFGDWTVEQARTADGLSSCRLVSEVEGIAGEVGLTVTANGSLFLSFRDDRVRMPAEWVGRTISVAFPDGSRFTLPIARLLRSDGTQRPPNTVLARLDAPVRGVQRHFYTADSLSVLLPDGSVHDALLNGAGVAANAMAACERRIAAAK